MKIGNFDKDVSWEFLTDLVVIIADATEKGANTIKFMLPKRIEQLPDVEITISWRLKK